MFTVQVIAQNNVIPIKAHFWPISNYRAPIMVFLQSIPNFTAITSTLEQRSKTPPLLLAGTMVDSQDAGLELKEGDVDPGASFMAVFQAVQDHWLGSFLLNVLGYALIIVPAALLIRRWQNNPQIKKGESLMSQQLLILHAPGALHDQACISLTTLMQYQQHTPARLSQGEMHTPLKSHTLDPHFFLT